MCGIAGFCDYTKTLDTGVLKAMTDTIVHRGPDSDGAEVIEIDNAKLGFGHRRLSILDLSPLGSQPMHFEDLTIVFNGEVYNFHEIKEELEALGHKFRSHSDTEVILIAYKQWGMASLEKFIGMFAYALYDAGLRKMFLVRDRVGVKPLYVYQDDDILIYGSELKPFHKNPLFKKELDLDSLAQYLKLSYIPTPYCIFKKTQKVKPGHYLEVSLETKEVKEIKYWDVVDAYNQPKLSTSYEEAVEETNRILTSAFNYRMVADVPVGVFLSGGYDSTAVAALIQKERTDRIKTFTIGFKEAEYNEAEDAKRIADHIGTDHTELYCTPNEAEDILDNLAHIYDEPFADNSVVPTVLVSRLAREQVTVALSGDGGDEIFAGYNKFKQSIDFTRKYPELLQSSLAGVMSWFNPEKIPVLSSQYNFSTRYEKMINIWRTHSPFVAMRNISNYITDNETKRLLKNPYRDLPTYFDIADELNDTNDDLNKLLAIDYKTFLMDNNLVKIDRASMSVSLEGREPFLDQRVIEFLSRLPGDFKIRNGRTKSLLKDVVHKYVDPKLMDRPKKPFIAPLKIWFREEMRNLLIDHVNRETLERQGVFNADAVLKMRDQYLQGESVSHQKIWNILLFQIWYNTYMD
jgi:asparagine synthase (glutamine-hydrolysing)